MEKLLTFHSRSASGVFAYAIDTEHRHLIKTAGEYHPTIAAYINNAKKISGKTQILITALGAGEFWGSNANGDFFPESALANEGDTHGYKTFEKHARVFKHHVNKPDSPSYGEVLLSVYNPTFHRVELIITFDHARAPDLVEKIDRGETVEFSMGCKVPYDVCSICGNRAATRAQYCEHLKYYLGKIHPETKKQVYAINTLPRFFDISYVLIGADKTAKSHLKVASLGGYATGSAELAEKHAAKKLAVHNKRATIEKEVPAGEAPSSQRVLSPGEASALRNLTAAMQELRSREESLPLPILNRLGEMPLGQSMSTMAMMGMMPKPEEFQRVICIKFKRPDLADYLDSRRECFDPYSATRPAGDLDNLMPISSGNFSEGIMRMLAPFIPARSAFSPHIDRRVTILVKSAVDARPYTFLKCADGDNRKPVGLPAVLALAAGLYAVLSRRAPIEAGGKGLMEVVERHPALAAAIGYGLYRTFNPLVKPGVMGQSSGQRLNGDVNVPGQYSRNLRDPMAKTGGRFVNHIVLGIPAAYMASGVLQAHKDQNPHYQEGRISSFMRRYPDLISAGLAVSAVRPLLKKAHESLLRKEGAFEDFVLGAIVPAISFGGGPSLPGRIVGGAFDQGVISLAKKWHNKRQQKGDNQNLGE